MRHVHHENVEQARGLQNSFPVTAQILRRWCVPETILAITNLFDEDSLLLHAIGQARRSGARVLLAHVLDSRSPEPDIENKMHVGDAQSFAEYAQATLHRMAEYMHWSGVQCETKLLRGAPSHAIRALASSRAVDRILLVVEGKAGGTSHAPRTLAEDIVPGLKIPVCTISRAVTRLRGNDRPPGGIVLAVSLRSDCTVPLAFACRLAQEHRTSLKVIHVFDDDDKTIPSVERSPISVASRLPLSVLREAELFCPVEVTVREGDPASEILKYNRSADQGFLVLGPIAASSRSSSENVTLLHRVMSEACCPVITFGQVPNGDRWESRDLLPGPRLLQIVRQ